jgi:hypothetical protein
VRRLELVVPSLSRLALELVAQLAQAARSQSLAGLAPRLLVVLSR